jgi:hypothetical protein
VTSPPTVAFDRQKLRSVPRQRNSETAKWLIVSLGLTQSHVNPLEFLLSKHGELINDHQQDALALILQLLKSFASEILEH